MGKELRIALVLTAGGLKEIYNKSGKRFPFWYHWPLFKNRIKKLEERGEVKVVHAEKLKNETIARLQKALELYMIGEIHLVVCTGGYSPKRKKLGLKDSVEMMNEWLIANGANKQLVIGGDAFSVDTGTNIEEFLDHLKKLIISQKPTIYVVTSWYHLFRAKYELKSALRKNGIEAAIIATPVYPKFDAETLKYEYAWNLLTEPIKILGLAFPWIKLKMRKKEYEARK